MVDERRRKTNSDRARSPRQTESNRLENALEIGLLDTFPASDAIAAVQPCSNSKATPIPQAIEGDAAVNDGVETVTAGKT
jgi:hypothetical protein